MDIAKLESLLTVKQVAEMHDVPTRVVRREAKAGRLPGTIQVLGKYGFDPELATEWTPPEVGTRVGVSKREDGRLRYRIYLTPEEAETLTASGYEIHDPREAAKARRAARKAAKADAAAGEEGGAPEAVAETDDENPFADFEA